MITKKQRAQESKMPPGKEKPPKPQPAIDPTPSVSDGTSEELEENKTQDQVIAPDGEPEIKKEPEPLF